MRRHLNESNMPGTEPKSRFCRFRSRQLSLIGRIWHQGLGMFMMPVVPGELCWCFIVLAVSTSSNGLQNPHRCLMCSWAVVRRDKTFSVFQLFAVATILLNSATSGHCPSFLFHFLSSLVRVPPPRNICWCRLNTSS